MSTAVPDQPFTANLSIRLNYQRCISPELTTMTIFSQALADGFINTADALALFDSLEIAEADFMLGHWKGSGFPTNHRLDGVLEAYHWYGKRFDSPEDVHPLVFTSLSGSTVSLNPARMPLGLLNSMPVPRAAVVGRLFQLLFPLLTTRRSRARLRMTRYRDKVSATMIYDDLPINDVFRKVDDRTLLGIMDLKGMVQPFFFILRRV
jgi:hypothetical protein